MFSVLTKLDWFFKEHWKRYAAAILLLILGGILEIIPPKMIGVAIDEMQLGTLTGERLWSILLFYVVLAIVTYLINFVWICKLFGGAFLAERTLRSKLMTHFLRMTPTFY
ncbi:multidrug ABC transporter permease/ATP-binding protein, partial [Mesorhizobium sp. M00.F.Ca.ET.186.01.1.1]